MEILEACPHVVTFWVGAHEPDQTFKPVAHQLRLAQLLGHRRDPLVRCPEFGIFSFHLLTCRSAPEHSRPPPALGYRVGTSLWEASALFQGRSAGMISAVYQPSPPLAFSLCALLALSSSWLSVLPALTFASPFRPLPSPAVCPALPSLLPAGALRLRPPVRRPQLRRNRRWRLLAKPGLSSSCSSFASGGRTTTSFPRPPPNRPPAS